MCNRHRRTLFADLGHHALARYLLHPVAFAVEQLHWTPDPQQAAILASDCPRIAMNWSSQTGKSSVLAA